MADTGRVDPWSYRAVVPLLEKQDDNLEKQLSSLQKTVEIQMLEYQNAVEEIQECRMLSGTVEQRYEDVLDAQHKLAALEDKKHEVLAGKGAKQHVSCTLKNEIDGMRRERKLFEVIERKKRNDITGIAQEAFGLLKNVAACMETQSKTKQMMIQVKEQYQKEELRWRSTWEREETKLKEFQEAEIKDQEAKARARMERVNEILFVNKNNVKRMNKNTDVPVLLDLIRTNVNALQASVAKYESQLEQVKSILPGEWNPLPTPVVSQYT